MITIPCMSFKEPHADKDFTVIVNLAAATTCQVLNADDAYIRGGAPGQAGQAMA